MSKSWTSLVVGVSLVGSVALVSSAASPDDRAKAEYINYCASCHGADGTGNGPMSEALKGEPADLTMLSTNNNGHFPFLKLRKTIDGSVDTGSLRSHSSREMPVWGDAFRRQSTSDTKWMDTQAKIMSIVDYLSTIQK
jgi:mono/diheme cytochrome c family protein